MPFYYDPADPTDRVEEYHQTVILDQDTTLRDITVFDITYRGFYTSGRILLNNRTLNVKIFEGESSWEVMR